MEEIKEMTNDMVLDEVPKEVTFESGNKFAVAFGIGVIVLAGWGLYKKVIKPAIDHAKASKESEEGSPKRS